MMVIVDIAIIGAGIAGVSVAYELAERHDVVVLEQESQPARHSTGRSAAMFLETYEGPAVRALTAASRATYDEIGGLLASRPMLWVGDPDRIAALRAENPGLEPADAAALCPVLRPEWRTGALLEPRAMEIDVLGLHQHYLGGAKRRGATVRTDAAVSSGTRRRGRWTLDTGTGPVTADLVVNAAGAWADVVAGALGVAPVGLRPMRRTAAVARADGVDRHWPLVADVSEGFYFRPEGAGVLISPADEIPTDPCDARPDDLDVALAIERVNEATTLGLRSVQTAWAGLRTFAPDRVPVVGPDPAEPAFFWLAGQGGFGIQTAPALAKAAAAAIMDGAALPTAIEVSRLR